MIILKGNPLIDLWDEWMLHDIAYRQEEGAGKHSLKYQQILFSVHSKKRIESAFCFANSIKTGF